MTTEEAMRDAKAFVAAVVDGVVTNGPVEFDLRDVHRIDPCSMPRRWRDNATEEEREVLYQEYPTRSAALAAAYDTLHPGEAPDVVVLPAAMVKPVAFPDSTIGRHKAIDALRDSLKAALSGKEMTPQK